MKIFIDGRLYGLEHAGVGRYLINLIDQLQKIDAENEYHILLRKKYYDSLDLNSNWTKIKGEYGVYNFREQLLLPLIIKKVSPDLVHFPLFNIPIFFRGRFVTTIHDMTMHWQKKDASKLPLLVYLVKRIPYKMAFRRAVLASEKLIVPSKSVKRDIMDYFKVDAEKIEVVYEGVDTEKFTLKENNEDKNALKKYQLDSGNYLIYVGNAFPHKNLPRAVEAVGLVNKKSKKKYVLAVSSARNYFTRSLTNASSKLDLTSCVKILGFVPDSDLPALLNNSLAYIYPSLSEGFGLQGLEAMTSGTLLLASDIPVFKEIYKKKAIYFNPYDYTSIAKAIEEAVSLNAKVRKRRIIVGKKFARNYSWGKMAKETLSLYKKCKA